MNCPKCETQLESTRFRDVEVDRCPGCRGIWFDESELPALLDLTRAELKSLQSARVNEEMNQTRGKCPRDHQSLLRVYSPRNEAVVIDTCVQCGGIWLDDGELGKLARR